jgi:hypothetical protein
MKHQHHRAALRRKLSIGRKFGLCDVSDVRYAILFSEIAFSNHTTPFLINQVSASRMCAETFSPVSLTRALSTSTADH